MSRRQFLKYGGAAVAAGVVGTTGVLALKNESSEVSVEHILIPIKRLPEALSGLTIAQISDIHLLPYTRPEFVERAVAITNNLNPDVTVLTGDYVWHDREAMFELSPIIARLNARYGVYGILGNHDYWLDVNLVLEGFRQARIPMLINEHVPITTGGSTLVLAGLDDGWSGHPDLDAALNGLQRMLLLSCFCMSQTWRTNTARMAAAPCNWPAIRTADRCVCLALALWCFPTSDKNTISDCTRLMTCGYTPTGGLAISAYLYA